MHRYQNKCFSQYTVLYYTLETRSLYPVQPLPLACSSQQMHFTTEFANLPHSTIFKTCQFKSCLKIASCAVPVPNAKPYLDLIPTNPHWYCSVNLQYSSSIFLLKHTQGTCLRKLERFRSPSLHTGQESASSNDCDLLHQGLANKTRLRIATNTAVLSQAP